MSWSHGAGRKGGRRGPLGAGRAPRSRPARLRPAEGDRLQQAAALRRAAGRRVRLAAGPDQKQPGPGSAAPRAVARGPLLDQETLHVSVPGPAGWAGGKGLGVKASAGGGGEALCPHRTAGPSTLPRFGRIVSVQSSQGRDRSLGSTQASSLPLSYGISLVLTSPLCPSQLLLPKVSGCCLPTFGARGSVRALDPQGKRGAVPQGSSLDLCRWREGAERIRRWANNSTFPGVDSSFFLPYGPCLFLSLSSRLVTF